jgi:hypothetical protein
MDDLAQRLNMRRLGWIFTDLIPDENKSGPGPVIHHRGNMVRRIIESFKSCFQ